VFWNINGAGQSIGKGEKAALGETNKFYYLKDHLGSVRITVAQNGSIASYDDYDPWGLQLGGRCGNSGDANAKYKFIGVELDASTGYYETGPRLFDPWSGRFNRPDRFADRYAFISPYSYGFNNPIVFLDASGDTVVMTGQDRNAALTDMQQLAGSDANRVTMDSNGNLVISTENYEVGSNEGLDLLIEANNASARIGYAVSSDEQKVDINGRVIGCGIENASNTHRFVGEPEEASLPHGQYPSKGLDGEVKVSTKVEFSAGGNKSERKQIVGHEMKENYQRTVKGDSYKSAHARANKQFFGGDQSTKIDVRLKK